MKWRCSQWIYPENLETPWKKYFPSNITGLKPLTRPFGDKETKRKFALLIDDFKPDVVHLNNIHTQLSHNFLQNYGGTQKHQCRLGTVDDFISEYKRINQSPNGHLEVCLAVNFVSKAELTRIFANSNSKCKFTKAFRKSIL